MSLAITIYIVGFAVPFWATVSETDGGHTITFQEGLWVLCTEDSGVGQSSKSCDKLGFDLAGWFHAVRSLEGVSLSLQLLSYFFGLIINCCKKKPCTRTRVQEFLAFIGGLVGLVGVIVYGNLRVGKTIYDLSLLPTAPDVLLVSLYTYDWGLYFTGFGCILVLIAAIVIGVGNKRLIRPVTGSVVGMTVIQTVQAASMPAGHINYPYKIEQPTYEYDYPGRAPAQAGYSPFQSGYPQAQNGYPQYQAGYSPAKNSNPRSPASYPPQASCPPQTGHPPQTGYPPEADYPPQAGYLPTQAAYEPQKY